MLNCRSVCYSPRPRTLPTPLHPAPAVHLAAVLHWCLRACPGSCQAWTSSQREPGSLPPCRPPCASLMCSPAHSPSNAFQKPAPLSLWWWCRCTSALCSQASLPPNVHGRWAKAAPSTSSQTFSPSTDQERWRARSAAASHQRHLQRPLPPPTPPPPLPPLSPTLPRPPHPPSHLKPLCFAQLVHLSVHS